MAKGLGGIGFIPRQNRFSGVDINVPEVGFGCVGGYCYSGTCNYGKRSRDDIFLRREMRGLPPGAGGAKAVHID